METILPAFISTNERREPASIKVNEQSITQFPFDKIIENPTDLKVEKKKAGQITTLKVEVEVKADADYVMIEIPIPAGCSYENKVQNLGSRNAQRIF
ncbi:MAG: hypothetical protein EOO86_17320 [Pedobacter sp.]|nr:MAG: hypothetical protein EOO86_17320 [Pedobacter sp.]